MITNLKNIFEDTIGDDGILRTFSDLSIFSKVGKIQLIARILLEAYFIEQAKRNVIMETLLRLKDKKVWDTIFQVHIGNLIHKDMLLEAIEKLGYKYEGDECEIFKFTGKSEEELLEAIYDWECFSFNYYKNLLKIVSSDGLRMAMVDCDGLKRVLEDLVKSEEKQIEMLQKRLYKL